MTVNKKQRRRKSNQIHKRKKTKILNMLIGIQEWKSKLFHIKNNVKCTEEYTLDDIANKMNMRRKTLDDW